MRIQDLTLAEYGKRIEEQMPLVNAGGILFILGIVILVVIITELTSRIKGGISKSDKMLLIFLSIAFGSVIFGIGLYLLAVVRIVSV